MSSDALSAEAIAQLDRWSAKARGLLDELLDDAGTDLQRELIQRSVAAGHSPVEVHAFADELRALSDDEAFSACTLDDDAPADYTVTQLLRAQGDPLFAFELKGGQLSPADEDDSMALKPEHRAAEVPATDALSDGLARKPIKTTRPASPGEATPAEPLVARPTTRSKADAFDAESADTLTAHRSQWGELTAAVTPNRPVTGSNAAVVAGRLLEDVVTEATRPQGLSWREYELDTDKGLPLEEAVTAALAALARGLPVPCAIGPKAGESRRFVLALQALASGRSRAWQLYDPLNQELVWCNEATLLARTELPFANKANRRLTRMVLPGASRASF